MSQSLAALGSTFSSSPLIKLVPSGCRKSTCPDQLVVIKGLPDKVNSNKGLPNPSPLVRETIALTLG